MKGRIFCLLDTLDLEKNRMVINAKTQYSLEQCIAEQIVKDKDDKENIDKVTQLHSDYFNLIWISYKNNEIEIDIESGNCVVNGEKRGFTKVPCEKISEYLRPHRQTWFYKDNDNEWLDLKGLRAKFFQKFFHVYDLPQPDRRWPDKEVVKHKFNEHVKIIRFNLDEYIIQTNSRRCKVRVKLPHNPKEGYDGAFISRQHARRIPDIKYILPLDGSDEDWTFEAGANKENVPHIEEYE
jgi:hypothetical protein